MAVLAECPFCHKKQSTRNRLCCCGTDLVNLKRSKKVKYWIGYRLPGGKQRRELVGYSIEEAKDAEGKRRSQKRENRIFEMLPEATITFRELTDWYLSLKSVQSLASYRRIKVALASFNDVFGDRVVNTIKPSELEDYQEKRDEQGKAAATIDMELSIAKTMISKAFDNDMVDGRIMKAFRRIKRKLKPGRNARSRTLDFNEYLSLIEVAPVHLKAILIVAYNTGMRKGELLGLKWSHIDSGKRFIRLPAEMTKEDKAKIIPVNGLVKKVLDELPRALHHDFVFSYRGKPIADDLRTALRAACKTAGILYGQNINGGMRFHDIRTTVKTNMLRAGVDKALRDTILGHSLKGMDTFYLKPTDEDLTRAMEQFTEWLDARLAEAYANVDQNVDQKEARG